MVFFVNINYKHKHNVIFNKTVTKLVTILTKYFLQYLNPTSYLNKERFVSRKTKQYKRCDHRIKLVEEIKNIRQPNFKTSVLALYYYCADNIKTDFSQQHGG